MHLVFSILLACVLFAVTSVHGIDDLQNLKRTGVKFMDEVFNILTPRPSIFGHFLTSHLSRVNKKEIVA